MGDTKSIMFLERRTPVLDRRYDNSTAVFRVRIGRRQVDQLLAIGGGFTIDDLKPHEALDRLWNNGRTPQPLRVPPHHRHVG
jgi:hypothetical protein